MTKSHIPYLEHIRDALVIIRKAQAKGKETFLNDVFVQHATYHNLQIVGEAARKLDAEWLKQNSDIPWGKVIALRNILVHAYHGVDPEIIWLIIETDLVELEKFVQEQIKKEP